MEQQISIRFSEKHQVYTIDLYNPLHEDVVYVCNTYKEATDWLRSLSTPPEHIVINSDINKESN